ncbi:F0F1 ATP synthase subunit B family protein [Yunchengibacter salinarum]|uniref:F0F1 ATP synthase subunit B family protein n=1 Tax=Yunchengibacter salinarum TaxID=3133399 RepID=UPI0035B64B3B
MAQDQTNTQVEVDAKGGLPQLNVFEDGTYTSQLFWLAITFILFYVVVSRMVLPRISRVLDDRGERVAADLDAAERLKREAEQVQSGLKASLDDARSQSQAILAEAKQDAASSLAATQADLESRLKAKTEAAEKRIEEAKTAALEEMDDVARDVAADIVTKLGAGAPDSAALDKAVKAASARQQSNREA